MALRIALISSALSVVPTVDEVVVVEVNIVHCSHSPGHVVLKEVLVEDADEDVEDNVVHCNSSQEHVEAKVVVVEVAGVEVAFVWCSLSSGSAHKP